MKSASISTIKSFAKLADVTDRGLQMLLKQVHTETVITAMRKAPKAAREAILRNVSRRMAARIETATASEAGYNAKRTREARRKMVCAANTLLEKGTVLLRKDAMPPESHANELRDKLDDALRRIPTVERNAEQMTAIFVLLAELARREGVLAMEPYIDKLDPISRAGMIEMLEGVDEQIIADLLDSMSARLLADLELRLDLVRVSVSAIQQGCSPDMVLQWCRTMADGCPKTSDKS